MHGGAGFAAQGGGADPVLEAAAFSPIHLLIEPMGLPEKITDDLTATVTRLAPAIPQVAAQFGIEVEEGAAMPRPLRNNPAKERREKKAAAKSQRPKSDKASPATDSPTESEDANSEADSQVDAAITTQIDQPEAPVEAPATVEAEPSIETETELQAEEASAQDDSAAELESAPEDAATDADDQASGESEGTSSESSDDDV